MLRVTRIEIEWEPHPGATKYEIYRDGVKVSSAGPLKRKTLISVDDVDVIGVQAIPNGEMQEIDFKQEA